jgi:hypothetical protein
VEISRVLCPTWELVKSTDFNQQTRQTTMVEDSIFSLLQLLFFSTSCVAAIT